MEKAKEDVAKREEALTVKGQEQEAAAAAHARSIADDRSQMQNLQAEFR